MPSQPPRRSVAGMDAKESKEARAGYVVECFWPGVTPAAHEDASRRLQTAAAQLEPELGPLVYLGSLLVPEDEVVFLQFEAADADVCRTVATVAGIDYERVVKTVRLSGGERQQA